MRITVVIPVLNEEKTIATTLSALMVLAPDEVIVVDGGSRDRTRAIIEKTNTLLLSSPRGRARQMNRGAKEANGDVLLFLHADTRLPASALEDIRAVLRDPECIGGRFDVELEGDHWALKWIGALISLRSRVTKVATGDQAIFVRRKVFEEIGRFPDIPIMEDIALSHMLKKKGKVACLKSRVVTSARRWEVEGVWRTIFKMWMLKLLFLAGLPPVHLKRFYADTR
jgi:rSAM/selenodomain-associated transferase 2